MSWHPVRTFKEQRWTLAFVGFLAYLATTLTYEIPLGATGMAVAIAALPFEKKGGRWFVAPVVLFAALLAWAAVTVVFSPVSSAEPWEAVIDLGKVWLIFLVACAVLGSWARLRLALGLYLALYLLYPVRGAFANYFLAGYTLNGRMIWNYIYENPNDFAAYTFLPLSIALAVLVTARERWVRRLAMGATGLMVVAILLTQSRAGMLGLFVFAILVFKALRAWRGPRVALLAALAVIAVQVAPQDVWDRLGGLRHATESLEEVDEEGSALQRWTIMKVGMRIASNHPVTGVGLGRYPAAHAQETARDIGLAFARGERDAHSTYIRMLAETGIVGLGLFLGLLGVVWRRSRAALQRIRANHPLNAVVRLLTYSAAAFLTTGLFGSYGTLAFFYIHLALLWAASEAALREGRATSRKASRLPRLARI